MFAHLIQMQSLQADWSTRTANRAAATAQLLAYGLSADDLREVWAIGEAAYARLTTLQQGWVEDWAAWFDYANAAKGANTVGKLVEREGNIFGRAAALASAQAAALTGVLENVDVDYAFWVTAKLEVAKTGAKPRALWPLGWLQS